MIVEFELGIIEGDKKRALENLIGSSYFTQRKSYDEYYFNESKLNVCWGLGELMSLAEHFKITIGSDRIYFEQD